jgi:N-acetylmuramoyl-L-alanine amidase
LKLEINKTNRRARPMKKLIASMAMGISLLIATPAFAYTVQSGDTMSEIARQHDLTLEELATLNPQVKNLNLIYVGQEIKTSPEAHTAPSKAFNTSAYEKDLLARLVRAEAQGEPYAGKVAVAVTVLNRVDHEGFPNNIHDVIYQVANGYYQFTPVANGEINRPADAESIKAVEEALSFDRSQGAGSLFFYNPSTATSRWLDSRPTTLVIGNHVFKK